MGVCVGPDRVGRRGAPGPVSQGTKGGGVAVATAPPFVAWGPVSRPGESAGQSPLARVTKSARSRLCWTRDGSWTYIMWPAS